MNFNPVVKENEGDDLDRSPYNDLDGMGDDPEDYPAKSSDRVPAMP
jgi:hypothetical protein